MPIELTSDHRVYGVTGDLFPHDIRFDPDDAAHCARLDDDRLFFRVLAENVFTEGLLVIRRGGHVIGHDLERVPGRGRFGVWEAAIDDLGEPFDYSFAFRSEPGAAVYLAPSGVTNAIERLDRWHLDPAMLPVHEVPAWTRGAVIYQIFPDRFARGDESLTPPDSREWGTEPHPLDFQGGDLTGVAERVGYFDRLGIDAIYLNPIFTSPSNHRYDTIDYYSVDPALGGNDAFRRLVATMHERGIRVILDTSFNHCHPRFEHFADLVARGTESPYVDWFDVREFPVRVKHRPGAIDEGMYPDWGRQRAATLEDETGLAVEIAEDDGPLFEPTFDAWYGVPTMPRVNLQHPAARRYMLDVAVHWVKEYDIDGWRMDVTRYVDTDFWDDFRQEVKAVKPDCYLVAEVMGDAGIWLQGDRFDATMNYTFRDLCLDYFATATIDTAAFLDGFGRLRAMYSPAVTGVNFNLLSSHDTPRALTVGGGDRRRLLLATLFQLTTPGAASIYYGDELGMSGGEDPGSRGAFPVEVPEEGRRLLEAASELVQLRKSNDALGRGGWELLDQSADAFSYRRYTDTEEVAVAINVGEGPAVLSLGGGRNGRLLWGEGSVTRDGDTTRIEAVPAMGGAVVAL